MSGPMRASVPSPSDPVVDVDPPPGFDVDDRRPDAPEAPPEPVFFKSKPRAAAGAGDSDVSGFSQPASSAAEATQYEWSDRNRGRWDDRWNQSRGNDWNAGDQWAEQCDWKRRSSWDTSASTTVDGGEASTRKQQGTADPWRDGADPWSSHLRGDWKDQGEWRDYGARGHGHADHRRDPWADGRDGVPRGRDPADCQQASWNQAPAGAGVAWNGWSFFENGGFKTKAGGQPATQGGGRASEKLAVPSFSGDDGEDVGGSARSYLRQVEAWRRMTLLPASQQGLVLYQNLTGKAWIAAEELSVDRLACDNGVEYFVQWLNARFLDLEVARIGRAFSEFFRKLRRRPNQSIREYNTEYGADENVEDEDELDYYDGEGIPEEVAVAYATYQSAKDKYKEQAKSRGYQGDRAAGGGRERGGQGPGTSREDKVRLMKARSYCMSCGKKGHWHKDPECPNKAGAKEVEMCHHVPAEVYALKHEGNMLLGITDTACAKSVAGTVWLQQYSDCVEQSQGKPELIRESEAFKFGTGKVHHSAFHVLVRFKLGDKVIEMKTSIINGDIPLLLSKSALAQLGMVYDVAENRADFTKVGLNQFPLVTTSSGHPAIPIVPARPDDRCTKLAIEDHGASGNRAYMAFAVSSSSLSRASTNNYRPQDIPTSAAPAPSPQVYHRLNNATDNETISTSTSKTAAAAREGVVLPEWGCQYKIFYDKKLSPEVRELLSQDRLQGVSFIAWWRRTKIASDFWLESEHAWHRIHVTPRRALCNPFTWKTQSTLQKDMLLKSISDVRDMDSSCKPPAISKMNKVQLLSEASRLGLVVHRNWSVEEIKAVIQEHRMNDAANTPAHQMRSVTNLTLPELKVKATELGVMFPSNITKGNLLRLVRDHVGTPANELMKIGKYKGWEFQEIPKEYGMWAAREVRMNGNPHVELVRFAKWWEDDQYQKHYGDQANIEKNATVPFPDSPSQAAPSGASSSAGTSLHEWRVTGLPTQHDDYPIPPKVNKRGSSGAGYSADMDQEIDPKTLEEIRALETRLAVLKDKAKVGSTPTKKTNVAMRGARRPKSANDFYKGHEDALIDREKTYYMIKNDPAMYYHDYDTAMNDIFITEDDLEKAKESKHLNFECSTQRQHHDDPFVKAMADCDYSEKTLLKLLQGAEFEE
ncbi:unnamed protein product, partial [Symbiodinium microadriaticum]